MSIGESEEQTCRVTVSLVCVCTCWWSLQGRRGNISGNSPRRGKEEMVEKVFCQENLQQYSHPFAIQRSVLASPAVRCCSWGGAAHATPGGSAASSMLSGPSAAAEPGLE